MAKGREPRIKTVEDKNIERVKEMLAKLGQEHEFKAAMFVGLDKDGQVIKCSEGGGLFDLIGMLEFAKMTLLSEFHVAE